MGLGAFMSALSTKLHKESTRGGAKNVVGAGVLMVHPHQIRGEQYTVDRNTCGRGTKTCIEARGAL
jgi:hypothetical protein